MNPYGIHVNHRHVAHILNAKFKELLRHVHVYLNTLELHQIVDQNVLVTVNVHTI